MLRKDGYAKVLDFGLAKLSEPKAIATGSEDATRVQVNTTPGMVMGTVSYMSPEQARGNVTDARTDIWSLGVVLYEMLAGKVPFTGETVNHTIVSILEKEPLLLENVPAELQRIVRKSMTKDVDMRYQSARDLLIDLKNLRRDLDIQGELERSIVPNRETAECTHLKMQTQIYASDAVAATSSGQAAATQSLTTSSSSLEYAVTQAKSHKLATRDNWDLAGRSDLGRRLLCVCFQKRQHKAGQFDRRDAIRQRERQCRRRVSLRRHDRNIDRQLVAIAEFECEVSFVRLSL